MKSSYPIIKYSESIEQKLNNQQSVSVVTEEIDSDDFAKNIELNIPSQPLAIHEKVKFGVAGIWVTIAVLFALKLISAGVFVAILLASGVMGAGLYSRLAGRYERLIRNRKSLIKRVPVNTRKRVKQRSIPIDWTNDIARLIRSSKKSEAKVGLSEEFFLKHLAKLPLGRVEFGHEYLPPGYSRPYSADIELIIHNGLGIQIEIDEPYVGNTRQPHHCCDSDKDIKRDLYFLSLGWIIIRFSERQVVTNPHACCGVIAETIVNLTGNVSLSYLAKLSKNLQPESQWTAAESRLMSRNEVRERYLSRAGLWTVRKNRKK